MRIAVFGSSAESTHGSGAAAYYRGLLRALAKRGHQITCYEPDAFERQQQALQAVEEARDADVMIKTGGVGVIDDLLEEAVLQARRPGGLAVYWVVDAPSTLQRLDGDRHHPRRARLPRYDVVLTQGGGRPVVDGFRALGARSCTPIYSAADPETHHPVARDERFRCTLAFLGSRLPDLEARVGEFFLKAAEAMPHERFLIGGNGWEDRPLPANVDYVGHVYRRDHNVLSSTARAVLHLTPGIPTRMFEAAGAGACLITDECQGISQLFEPGVEVLLAKSGTDVAEHLAGLTPDRARAVGAAARRRVLAEHTWAHRAAQVEALLAT
jgi:spore maturation protein CgeB